MAARDTTQAQSFMLSDGTTIGDLVDMERHEVALRLLSDPEVYEQELQRVFGKAWLVVGHETEIPDPGDYVMRYLGADSVIVARGNDGEIHISLNVCKHKGMQVCRDELGNQQSFVCPYHGWAYDNTGRFLGAPYQREAYGDAIDASALGLRPARAGTYAGLIFGTFDDAAPSLDDFLGDMRWYLDIMFSRTDAGFEVLGPPQRFIVDANWKTASEQTSDNYHTIGTHRSLLDLGFVTDAEGGGAPRVLYITGAATPRGHVMSCLDQTKIMVATAGSQQAELSPIEKLKMMPPTGMTPEMVPQLERNLTADQIAVLANDTPFAGGLFPNVLLTNFWGPTGTGVGPTASIHVYLPKGPDKFEFWNWILVEKDAPPEMRQAAKMASALSLGSSGIVEADDAETWPGQQRAARGVFGRQEKFRYLNVRGLSKANGFRGPGMVYSGICFDDAMWNWWLSYRDFMLGDPWSS
jgi:phenylpropionate dioxygenase-like ring-hydroxylating dioxygenase large terminal subunit